MGTDASPIPSALGAPIPAGGLIGHERSTERRLTQAR
jgi:hypothetical protein